MHVLADEFTRSVAQQCARNQAGFGQNLESVAHSKDVAASVGMLNNLLHDGRKTGNGARTKVVPVRKSAREHDHVNPLKVAFFMPKAYGFAAHALSEGLDHVLVAIRTRKSYNTEFHAAKVQRPLALPRALASR